MRTIYILLVLMLVSLNSYGGETAAQKIARAQSAAHPVVSRHATIMDVDGTMLQKGSNGWVCMPGIMPGDAHPMCNDAVWGRLMSAIGSKSDFKTEKPIG